MNEQLEQFRRWMILKNYSKKTQKCYLSALKNFWIFCERQKQNPKFKKEKAVETYLIRRFEIEKRAWQTINGDYSAIRLFYVPLVQVFPNRQAARSGLQDRVTLNLHVSQREKISRNVQTSFGKYLNPLD